MKGFLDAISAQYSWVVWSDDETIIVEWFDSISEKYKPVANDEELMTMFECFKQVRHGKVALKVLNEHEKRDELNADMPSTPSHATPSLALPSQPSNVSEETEEPTDTYLANPHEEYEHVGVDEEDQYSIGSACSDSDSSEDEVDNVVVDVDGVEDNCDDEEWIAEDAIPDDAPPDVAHNMEDPTMAVGTIYPNIEVFRLAIAQYSIKPCKHAISFITGIRGVTIEDFVDDYYSVAKFAAAYTPVMPGLTDASQWPKKTHEFFLHPPILRRAPGRPKLLGQISLVQGVYCQTLNNQLPNTRDKLIFMQCSIPP